MDTEFTAIVLFFTLVDAGLHLVLALSLKQILPSLLSLTKQQKRINDLENQPFAEWLCYVSLFV